MAKKKTKKAKPKQPTLRDFLDRFPDDEACIRTLFDARYGGMEACPSCAVVGAKYYRMRNKRCYECGQCGHQIYPLAGTVMHGSTTPPRLWFVALYMMAICKNGVSAKELQRQLGVTYKTAWRMGHAIRSLMGRPEGAPPLSGDVEVDESLIGGKAEGKRGWGAANKTCLFGMVERGGRIVTTAVPDRRRETLRPLMIEHIKAGTTVHTDEFKGYGDLAAAGWEHRSVVHSKYQWADGDSHTNTIEGHWSNLKKSVLGTYTFASRARLQSYVDEFDFRYSHRRGDAFGELLRRLSSP